MGTSSAWLSCQADGRSRYSRLGCVSSSRPPAAAGASRSSTSACPTAGPSDRHEETSLGRLLTRINTSAATAGAHAFLIFDEVREEPITRLYRRLRVHNPIPSRYEPWDNGSPTRNIPLDRIIGGPAFRSAEGDHLLQLAGFVAHALLLQEEGSGVGGEEPGPERAFSTLDHALNREASQRDPQGVVRR